MIIDSASAEASGSEGGSSGNSGGNNVSPLVLLGKLDKLKIIMKKMVTA